MFAPVGGGGEDAKRDGVPEAHNDGAVAPRCIHHGSDVVHPRLQRKEADDSVEHAGSALVESDQPANCGEAVQERADRDRLARIPRSGGS
jgi:hypothetical protein